MSNVIELKSPTRILPLDQRLAALIRLFAENRRQGDDVFWLKENAELLNVLETTGQAVPTEALAPLEGFYATVADRIAFFPQYYRFLLSLTLDLEDLGLEGGLGERLVNWAAAEGLADAEVSDLQRMEARRLMARRGCDPFPADPGLADRLRAFIARPQVFSVPNKKAAYELTHIVFYLSEYGRTDPDLDAAAMESLHYAGILALLDENADLLSEICIAMNFAGSQAPSAWTGWLSRATVSFKLFDGDILRPQDDYHRFLMCQWHDILSGAPAFRVAVPEGCVSFVGNTPRRAALREMSDCLFRLGQSRSGDWGLMRPVMDTALSEDAQAVVAAAELSSDRFPAFFEGFARARQVGAYA